MRALVCLIVLAAMFEGGYFMTEKQMKSSAKLVRNTCQPKSKVSDEAIDNMHKGNFADDPAAKCYMNCVLLMFKAVKKDGTIDMDAALKQVPTLPEARQAPTEKAMKACAEKVTNAGDKCEIAYNVAKCLYMENPENYFLP